MKMIAKQQATMANHQVMLQVPSEVRKKYFKELYESITLGSTNNRTEDGVLMLELQAWKRELETRTHEVSTNDNDETAKIWKTTTLW